jgi:hypothetical protein
MRILVVADSANARRRLQHALVSIGHTILDPMEFGAGALLATSAWHADAVVAGLFAARPSQQQRSAVLVEIGIALGRSAPVLLLTRPGTQPPALLGLPRVDANLEDADTLGIKLELLLQGVSHGAPREFMAGPSLQRQQGLPSPRYSAQTLEREVTELLTSNGSTFLKESDSKNRPRGFDFAFHLESGDLQFGLVLVEVKRLAVGDRGRLLDAAKILGQQVAASGAGLGLVVYESDSPMPMRRNLAPLVAAISVQQLREELLNRPIEEVIGRLRNEAVHGS